MNAMKDLRANIFQDDKKLCPSCNKWKPFNQYYKTKTSKSGIMSRCKPCETIRKREARELRLIDYRYKEYQRDAERRNREWSLTRDQYEELVTSPCAYCGDDTQLNGIDRVNSDLGYTVENTTPCCAICNKMKLNQTVEEFLEQCRRIITYVA